MTELTLGELRRNTIKKLTAANVDSPATCCDLLFSHFFSFDRLYILTNSNVYIRDAGIPEDKLAGFSGAVIRLCRKEPIQYITGTADFMGLVFKVNENVLIPRGDTEILATELNNKIKNLISSGISAPAVLDLCTGSGCIGVQASHYASSAKVTCSDISPAALSVAMENCNNILGAYDKIDFCCGSYFEGIPEGKKFNIIASNPPYIPTADIETLDENVKNHEPHLALDGGADGLSCYKEITKAAPGYLYDGGVLMFEVGIGEAQDVLKIMENEGFTGLKIVPDLANIDRVVIGALPKKEPPAHPAKELSKEIHADCTPITAIRGISDVRAAAFRRLSVETVEDLLELYPIRYEDRSRRTFVSDLCEGSPAVILIRVTSCAAKKLRQGLDAVFFTGSDGSGKIRITYYNATYVRHQISAGRDYIFYGTPSRDKFTAGIQMINPEFVAADDERKRQKFEQLLPVYPLAKGLSQNMVRDSMREAIRIKGTSLQNTNSVPEIEIPASIRAKFGLISARSARENIHFPSDLKTAEKAHRRLVFDELLELQLMLCDMKNNVSKDETPGIKFKSVDMDEFNKGLPFKLTCGQTKVIGEISADMESGKIMNRLVIGDVGSGKTVIAAAAMFKAIRNGYQAVYMAPTEILAEQHCRTLTKIFEPLGITVGLLTGALKASEKKKLKERIALGMIDCVIGTHALIQKDVQFKKAGIVITDEQHRFGVRQRAMLSSGASEKPDMLVMTATPIPRTLALILYGDLDISTLDVLPTGRLPIRTYPANTGMHERVYKWALENAKAGHQVYIVHPLVADVSRDGTEEFVEDKNLLSATANFEKLSATVFKDVSCGLLHGKMKASEKDDIMHKFAAGEISILFATTVIEVGVDVPNATIMIIENAERFGLAQLHQLRGRVGRGSEQSHCVLITDSKTGVAAERVKLMTSGCSGFELAEKDLELRGPGELFGTAQHGIPSMKIANLYDDMETLREAQKAAEEIITTLSDSDAPLYKEYKAYYDYAVAKTPKLINL